MMKPRICSALLSLVLVACHTSNVKINLQGTVHLPDQNPSVGMQGKLCFDVATEVKGKNFNSVCEALYSDQSGNFNLTLSQKVVRFFMANQNIKRAWVYLLVNNQKYSSQAIDPL